MERKGKGERGRKSRGREEKVGERKEGKGDEERKRGGEGLRHDCWGMDAPD